MGPSMQKGTVGPSAMTVVYMHLTVGVPLALVEEHHGSTAFP